ncbi:Predicted oxidoreductase [Rathayibacter oskolensis]|uniref:Predicted oxidoreductase n=1 Tax=Rathayibacter oskolensis TaxID=1891671 RepID=A0A1X7NZV6_9MICO|nr:aldo/keto reductase [Rathayibacter oskolensis]SMH44003.1 Predicted oxidoreductase [Rathayibacter oskolensis]
MSGFTDDQRVPLGRSDLEVSRLGFGTMPLSGVYGPIDSHDAANLLRTVLDAGVDFVDTSSYYGGGTVERAVGRAVKGRRHEVVIGTKFGMDRVGLGSAHHVRASLHQSLRRLGTDYIDIYYLHQIDPTTPIQDTVGALGDLVSEGLIRAVGLSEVTTETLRRAHSTYPIAAVQHEYSLLERTAEVELLPTARELGITLVAYSPLGRGLLSGAIRRPEDVPSDDGRRRRYPRFDEGHLARNIAAVEPLFRLAKRHGTTPADLALGWVLAAHNVITIPGTRRLANFEENLETSRGIQDADVTRWLSRHFPIGRAYGARYAEPVMTRLDEAP